ncbi:MAG: acetyl-CoA carboxylase biotin carboxylase subunit [Desulfocucumaceae bacterium]
MFKKILIANRGEIAVRVIRACREMGIAVASVHSEADSGAPHALEADETYLIGPPQVAQSYLNMAEIISAAVKCGAQAIHPGYGLLSENPEFAGACERAGLVFIGPPAGVIASMGIKTGARSIMREAGIPVVPGSGPLESPEEARGYAGEIGYPVMVKASAGGGGIGMQLVESEAMLEKSFNTCSARARAAFGNPALYIEKYIACPRHIEIQVFADKSGNVVHLGERECSIQRRHQKVIEESPSPLVDAEMRDRMGADAVRAARAIGYVGAGTVEFLVGEDNRYYFLEMNTRLQVEHPVTEMVTGTDLVVEQIRVAAGLPLSWGQEDIIMAGHSIECRVYAEDPANFRPSTGEITALEFPSPDLSAGERFRVDSGIKVGYRVSPYYDPLLLKIIVGAGSRERSLDLMREVLASTVISGVKTNIPLLLEVINHPAFCQGSISTDFIGKEVLCK